MTMVSKLAYLKRRDQLTTEDVSMRSGVAVGTLNKIFAGQTQNPALESIDRICRLFRVPIRFLLDDTVPEHCHISAYADSQGMFMISELEMRRIVHYRQLTEGEKRCVGQLIDQFIQRRPTPGRVCQERLIPCYEPTAYGKTGMFLEAWSIRTLRVPVDAVTQGADFALVLTSDRLSPAYDQGTVLALRQRECGNQELGLFVYQNELYLRKLQYRRGEVKLISVKTGVREIQVSAADNLQCMGVVLGTIRNYQYL